MRTTSYCILIAGIICSAVFLIGIGYAYQIPCITGTDEQIHQYCEKIISYDSSFSSGYLKVAPPSEGVYHSAFPDFGGSEDNVTLQRIIDFENMVGKRIVWVYFSNNWGSEPTFPERSVQIIHNHGVIPFIRIMPRTEVRDYNGSDPVYTLQRIIDGKIDNELIKWAQSAKNTGIPLMCEFGTEVNGDWVPWAGIYNGGGQTNGYGDPSLADGPERFRDAYRHIIDLFRKQGADNITWVYHVNKNSVPNEPWNNLSAYYPGDDYIDWIGISVYGAVQPEHKWQNFSVAFDKVYPELSSISSKKPLALLEFGVKDDPRLGNKSSWIHDALESIKNGRYPHLKAISYWHESWTEIDGVPRNLRLDSSPSALEEYRREISSPFFVTIPKYLHFDPIRNTN